MTTLYDGGGEPTTRNRSVRDAGTATARQLGRTETAEELERFCVNEMRKWADEARLEAYSRIKRQEVDARGHQRTIGKTGAKMLDGLLDGYAKSWARSEMGDAWMWKTYSDWRELGIKRTSARIQRRNLKDDDLILYKDGIRPGDGQAVVYYRLADPVDLFLKATEERLALIDASSRRDRFTERIKESLLEQKAKVLRWMEGEDESQLENPGSNDTPCDTDPPTQELLYLSDRDPLHKYSKEKSFLTETPKKAHGLSLDLRYAPKKSRSIKKVSDEVAHSSWATLCAGDDCGAELRMLGEIMAEGNESGEVAYTKVWRTLGQRYLKQRENRPHLSKDDWSEGFWAAILHDAPNIGYVVKAAEGSYRRADGDGHRAAAQDRRPHPQEEHWHQCSSKRRVYPPDDGDNGNGIAKGIGTRTRRRKPDSGYDRGDRVHLKDPVELDSSEACNRVRKEKLRRLTKGLFEKF
jgi:hypothetical protein